MNMGPGRVMTTQPFRDQARRGIAPAAGAVGWRRPATMIAAAALLACAGCSTFTDFQTVMRVPDGTPARPETPHEFPAIYETPPERENALLDPAEQARVERDLVRMRDRQAVRGPATPAKGRERHPRGKAADSDPDTGAADKP